MTVAGAVITGTCEAVQLVNQNKLKMFLRSILNHMLELRTPVRSSGLGTVNIGVDDLQIVTFSEIFADAKLAFNGFFALPVAGIPGVNDCISIFFIFHGFILSKGQLV
nr:hypothetical protein [Megasphaera hominis]